MAELFQTTQQNISQHIRNLFEAGELTPEATHKKFLSVRREGKRDVRCELDYHNLDMVISAGYRVKSLISTRFRIWATQCLKEYIVKGFVMDDERLREAGGTMVKKSWQEHYYATITAVLQKIQEKILQEDKTLLWKDLSLTEDERGRMMAKKQIFKAGFIMVTRPIDSKTLFHRLRGCALENNHLCSCQVNLIEREK